MSIADKMFEDLTYGKEENDYTINYWSNSKQKMITLSKREHEFYISSFKDKNTPRPYTIIEPGEFRAMAQKLKEMEG